MVDGGLESCSSGRSVSKLTRSPPRRWSHRTLINHVIVQVLDQLLPLLIAELSISISIILGEEHLNLHVREVTPRVGLFNQ